MVWYSGGKTHRGRRDLERTKGAKVGLIGTNQNLISDKTIPTDRTTPDALTVQRLLAQMVDAGCTYAVMEVSSHALMQSRVEGIRFRVGVFYPQRFKNRSATESEAAARTGERFQ